MKRLLLIITLLLGASPCFAAITLDTVTAPATRQSGGATVTISHTTGAQSAMVMVAFCETNGGTAGITATATYNSVTMDSAGTQGDSSDIYVIAFKLANPASGTHDFVATFTSPFDGFEECAVETWYGADTTTITRTASFTTGTDVTTSATPTCSSGDVLVDFIGLPSGSNTFVPGGSQTGRFTITNGAGSDTGIGSSASTCVTTTWDWTGSNGWRYMTLAIIPQAVTSPPRMTLLGVGR